MDILKQRSSTREDLGLLAVMEAIEDRRQVTQREIASETGLNLKKVNYCLHKLLEKGYVKFQRVRQNPDKRAYLYIMTPAGVKAKSQLTYNFLRLTLDFYNRMEEKLRGWLEAVKGAGVRRVLLYGASDVSRILIGMVGISSLEIKGIVDDVYGRDVFHGIPVVKTDRLAAIEWEGILITDLNGLEDAELKLREIGVAESTIWRLQ